MRDTIDMAREANLAKYGKGLREGVPAFINALKAFEAFVRADEREECAKVCETEGLGAKYQGDVYAIAIRERGKHEKLSVLAEAI